MEIFLLLLRRCIFHRCVCLSLSRLPNWGTDATLTVEAHSLIIALEQNKQLKTFVPGRESRSCNQRCGRSAKKMSDHQLNHCKFVRRHLWITEIFSTKFPNSPPTLVLKWNSSGKHTRLWQRLLWLCGGKQIVRDFWMSSERSWRRTTRWQSLNQMFSCLKDWLQLFLSVYPHCLGFKLWPEISEQRGGQERSRKILHTYAHRCLNSITD